MESNIAVAQLAALGQSARLAIFRRLVRAGAGGLCPGDLQNQLEITPSVLSFHLKELKGAGLISAEQRGRHWVYRADFAAMNQLLGYLTENCCADGPDPSCDINKDPACVTC